MNFQRISIYKGFLKSIKKKLSLPETQYWKNPVQNSNSIRPAVNPAGKSLR